jgi:hypothetical protein
MKHTAGIGDDGLMNSNWGYAYTNGFVVLAEGTEMFILWAIATGRRTNPSDNLSFKKELWLDGCL